MPCYSPLRAMIIGKKNNGKKLLKIIPESKFNELDHDGVEFINIPCGHCIGCRLKYSRIWADRCMAEASYHDSNLFITLTYDNDHLPPKLDYIEEDTGLIVESHIHSLVKRDVQLFIKRLRKEFPDQKIRYFACGEYGDKNMRPHYHIILFGLKLPDMKLHHKLDDSYLYFTSDIINKIWCSESEAKKPRDERVSNGFHIITMVNWSVCAYVARYVVKKQMGDNSQVYLDCYYEPEFTLMSRKPGIGRQFYEDHKEELYNDEVYLATEEGARKIKPNKYYDSLFDIDYPELMEDIRSDRKRASLVNDSIKSSLTDKQFIDRLKSEETVQAAKIHSLKRNEV